MRNILMIIVLAVSSFSFAMPSAFTDLFASGYWTGEAKYYDNDGNDKRFFYAAEISEDGKTFNTLTPPNADPEERFQRYALKEEGLGYALRFNPKLGTISGTLTGFKNENNAWVFSNNRITHKYTKSSDTQILVETYFGNKKHAEIMLSYQGSGALGLMWVLKSMMLYR